MAAAGRKVSQSHDGVAKCGVPLGILEPQSCPESTKATILLVCLAGLETVRR